jgi:hypothetical protein
MNESNESSACHAPCVCLLRTNNQHITPRSCEGTSVKVINGVVAAPGELDCYYRFGERVGGCINHTQSHFVVKTVTIRWVLSRGGQGMAAAELVDSPLSEFACRTCEVAITCGASVEDPNSKIMARKRSNSPRIDKMGCALSWCVMS